MQPQSAASAWRAPDTECIGVVEHPRAQECHVRLVVFTACIKGETRPSDLAPQHSLEEEMGSIGDEEASIDLDPPLLEARDLLEEGREMHHDTIADDADGLWVEDPRGDEMQGILVPRLVVNRVPGIGPTLEKRRGEIAAMKMSFERMIRAPSVVRGSVHKSALQCE
jgi:hypothetical protein